MIIKEKIEENYSIIPNAIIKNRDLSIGAKMVAIYILSLPKNWKIKIGYLASELGISHNTCNKYIKELITAEVIQRVQLKNTDGKFSDESIYIFGNNSKNAEEILSDFLQKNMKETEQKLENKNEKEINEIKNEFSNKSLENNDFNRKPNLPHTDNLSTNNKRESNKEKKYILQGFEKFCFFNLNHLKIKNSKEKIQELTFLDTKENESYLKFLAFRREKAKITKTTLKAINDKILKLKNEGFDICQIIEKSIECGWNGLFENKAFLKTQKIKTSCNLEKPKSNFEKSKQSKEILKRIYEINPDFSITDKEFIKNLSIDNKNVKYDGMYFSFA